MINESFIVVVMFVILCIGLVFFEVWLEQRKRDRRKEEIDNRFAPRDPENSDPYGPNNPPV